jgi:hypothetical protein
MSTPEVVYQYKLEVNKLDSQDFIDLPLPTILGVLNKTILGYVNAIHGIDNIYRQGVESFQRRIDDLQVLTINDLPDIIYINEGTNIYTGTLPSNYLHLLRSYSLATKDLCIDRALRNIIYSHDELNDILITKDPFKYPSFEWQELPINISSGKIYAYTDGSFIPTVLHIEYLKIPTEIDIAGYTKIDGTASANVDSELPNYLLQDIITMAARFTKAILQDKEGFSLLSGISNTPK